MTQGMHGAAGAIEPLEPGLWFERFEIIGSRADAPGRQLEPSLRHLFHLTQLTPAPLAHIFGVQVRESIFERLLEGELYDCASLLLLGPGMEFSISRSPGEGTVTADLSLAGGQIKAVATAASLSTAIILAYCKCVGSLRDGASLPLRATGPAPRTSRSAPRRLSMTH